MPNSDKKNVLIGITASIASYKIYDLIRLYKRNGYNVKVVLSQNALNFVSPLVIETLTNNKCYYDEFSARNDIEHISLCNWADVFVIAPITANTLSKIANSIADNLLTSLACAYIGTLKPFLVALAMNNNMWNNELFQKNLDALKKVNVEIIEPKEGFLACNAVAKGHLEDINIIFEKSLRAMFQKKENNSKKVLVTIGGTKEKIDNVRYITNLSSGKMGTALADNCYNLGYDVCAISTIPLNKPYEVIEVKSAVEMLENIKKHDYDYLIMAAAVGDFRVEEVFQNKIKKEDIKDGFSLKLVKNPDIIGTISKEKKQNQKTIGFCLTDVDLIETAKKKLKNKNLDFIIANEIDALNSDKNKVTIIDKNGKIININSDYKENIARKILEEVL